MRSGGFVLALALGGALGTLARYGLGGFTTFSSFGIETFRLIADGDWLRAGAYVALTNALGLAAVWLGYRAIEVLRI